MIRIKWSLLQRKVRKSLGFKYFVFFSLDVVVVVCSFFFALLMVGGGQKLIVVDKSLSLGYIFLFPLIKLPVFYYLGLYRFTWMFYSVRDTLTSMKACLWASVFFGLACYSVASHWMGLGSLLWPIFVLDGLFTFIGVTVSRVSKRIYLSLSHPKSNEGKRLLIVGAGVAGEQLVRSLHHARLNPYKIIGFIDDAPHKRRSIIHGIEVLGTRKDLPRLVQENQAEVVLVAIPSADSVVIRETVALVHQAGVNDVRTLPDYSELLKKPVDFHDVREVGAEDVLGRQPIHIDTNHMEGDFRGKRVLVTGAAGSIGSELCRQLSRFPLDKLLMVDHEETSLFHLLSEMNRITSISTEPHVADVRDRSHMRSFLLRNRPHVVLHAAAYKHVGMMERQPLEAVKNNVFGTLNLGEIACESGVERFVLISTDKAVNPRGVMGATKRVAEMIGQYLNRQGPTSFVAVRFGNVLGSRGSVLPIFREQLKRGGPLTVTHPEMQRYFMIPSEAALLVLQAAVLGRGGEVLVLDMGKPVKILELAKEVIRLAHLEPDVDVPIVFTGARPEEKLHEDILTAEEGTLATSNDRIFRANFSEMIDSDEFRKKLSRLERAAQGDPSISIIKALQDLVLNFHPSASSEKKVPT